MIYLKDLFLEVEDKSLIFCNQINPIFKSLRHPFLLMI